MKTIIAKMQEREGDYLLAVLLLANVLGASGALYILGQIKELW